MANRQPSLSGKLSRKEPSDAEFDEAMSEFCYGSDLAAAIIGAALAENALAAAIRAFLPIADDERGLFYNQGAPFGSFSNKIVSARSMTLISISQAEDLHIIRDVRNQFAHTLMALNFSNEHLALACSKLSHYQIDERDILRTAAPARRQFNAACYEISVEILEQTNAINRRKIDRLQHDLVLKDLVTKPGSALFSNFLGELLKPDVEKHR